jgi:hypothetical protein
MTSTPVTIGIDVAKAHLDVAVRPSGDAWQVPNTETGITDLLSKLAPLAPARSCWRRAGAGNWR